MKAIIENAIKTITKKAEAAVANDALKYSQSACNLANTLCAWDSNKRAEEERRIELEVIEGLKKDE